MTATKVRAKKRKDRQTHLHKPKGKVNDRVQAVGAERFGFVCVDPAKGRSMWMLADFFGRVIVPATIVEHDQGSLCEMAGQARVAFREHGLLDGVVAIERTGNYHRAVQAAFAKAGFETRIVHPFATKHFRLPVDPGNKTDETDLVAIFRAAVNGLGHLESPLDEPSRRLRLLARHRRDQVRKCSALCCQIREHLGLIMPGFDKCFPQLWENNVALPVARWAGSAAAIERAGRAGIESHLREQRIRFQPSSLEKVLAWAGQAASPDEDAALRHRILCDLDDDRRAKTEKIACLERDLAAPLCRTPYVLLLSIPGINVVSAAELAGEMGPIEHYANPNAITGRAGVRPSRSQSNLVDHADGPMVRCANRRLRAALFQIADNLVLCNGHYGGLASMWKSRKIDPRLIRTRLAKRFSRLTYALVAGRQTFRHPACRGRNYILQKLIDFHREHDTPMTQVFDDLKNAIDQLPENARADEARPLHEKLREIQGSRRGPRRLGEILPQVLARLEAGQVESLPSGDSDSN